MSNTSITAGYADVQGTRTFYEECGPDDGQDIVCVHTAGHDSLEWRHVLPELGAAGYHAHALDLPGHGKSLRPEGGLIDSIHEFAEFVWSFADERDIRDPVVAGCSIGGDIVLDLAANHADELTAIVSCEAALRTPTYPEGFLWLMEDESGMPGFGTFLYHASRHVHGSEADPENVEEHAWTHQRAINEVMQADLHGWNTHDITDRADKITCPVMYVHGVEDYFLPDNLVEETRKALPHCEYERMEGIGHYPMLETEEFSDRLLTFLEEL
jgi:pimeloyl-ACP methyl ester carboxylesterase